MSWNLNQIYQSTINFSKARANPDDCSDKRLEGIIPFAGLGTALFQFSMRGVTQAGVRHRTNILFSGLKIYTENTKPPNLNLNDFIKVKEAEGTYYVEKPVSRKTPCVFRCTCKDWYFVCSYSAWKHKVIFGAKAKPYIRKTPAPPVGYPYRNPKLVVIFCKHTLLSTILMSKNGLFKA